jgi:putative FmdB family regulatory protein
MPIYEYLCDDCGKRSEVFRRSMNETTIACGHCGSTRTHRAISQFAVVHSGEITASQEEEKHLDRLADMGEDGFDDFGDDF